MYNILSFSIIIISLIIIIVIISRKFPALANLDIDTVKSEKETKMKERIISNRLKRNIIKWLSKAQKFSQPIFKNIGVLFTWLYKKSVNLREKYKEESKLPETDIRKKTEVLFFDYEELEKKNEIDEAEKKLIEIIGLESKNIKAFKELGRLYVMKKNFTEAKETIKHSIKLLEAEEEEYNTQNNGDAKQIMEKPFDFNTEKGSAYLTLSLVCQSMENMEEADEFIKQALQIEPNNPRYLDTWLEISIIKKDKLAAEEAIERLEQANPENQKLGELKAKINEL